MPGSTRTYVQLTATEQVAADHCVTAFRQGAFRAKIMGANDVSRIRLGLYIAQALAAGGSTLLISPYPAVLHQTVQAWQQANRGGTYLGMWDDPRNEAPDLKSVLTKVESAQHLAETFFHSEAPVNVFATFSFWETLMAARRDHHLPSWSLALADRFRYGHIAAEPGEIMPGSPVLPARHHLQLALYRPDSRGGPRRSSAPGQELGPHPQGLVLGPVTRGRPRRDAASHVRPCTHTDGHGLEPLTLADLSAAAQARTAARDTCGRVDEVLPTHSCGVTEQRTALASPERSPPQRRVRRVLPWVAQPYRRRRTRPIHRSCSVPGRHRRQVLVHAARLTHTT